VAALVIFSVGLLDDVRKVHGEGVSAPAKLAGIVLAGSILSLAGVSTIFFRVPFLGIFSLTPDLSAFLTVLWVAGMANAINFIDGLDGLAAGITAIAAGSFFLYSMRLDDVGVLASGNIGPLIAIITLPWLGFAVQLLGAHHGDSGALLLGLLMASSRSPWGSDTQEAVSPSSSLALFIPLVILGVPMIDTAFAIVDASRRSGMRPPTKSIIIV
jgi:UDP-GlcNAc:undecaprenyl-phosphate GlcNAc-1-phosphate transferase